MKTFEIVKVVHGLLTAWMYSKGLTPENHIDVDTLQEPHEIYTMEGTVSEEFSEMFDIHQELENLTTDLEDFLETYNAKTKYPLKLYDIRLYECHECGELMIEVSLYR